MLSYGTPSSLFSCQTCFSIAGISLLLSERLTIDFRGQGTDCAGMIFVVYFDQICVYISISVDEFMSIHHFSSFTLQIISLSPVGVQLKWR